VFAFLIQKHGPQAVRPVFYDVLAFEAQQEINQANKNHGDGGCNQCLGLTTRSNC
jgi:hypothetical protein